MHLCERFGVWPTLNGDEYLWLHGASVGEVHGLAPLIKDLQKREPQTAILVTTISASGRAAAEALGVEARLLPFDAAWFLSRAWKRCRIKALIVSEVEIWPGLFCWCRERGIIINLVNARLSERSVRQYKQWQILFGKALASVNRWCVSSDKTAQRLHNLGVATEKIARTGNTKYDQQTPHLINEGSSYIKHPHRIVLGSIRPGEEQLWFAAISSVQKRFPTLEVIVAPRHQEKFEFFAERLSDYSIPFVRYTELPDKERVAEPGKVLLLNTLGKLASYYHGAAAAFIGATLQDDLGGHNPLEAAAVRCAVVLGPYGSVIEEIREDLVSHQGCLVVKTVADIVQVLEMVARADPALEKTASAGYEVSCMHRGAVERVLQELSLK